MKKLLILILLFITITPTKAGAQDTDTIRGVMKFSLDGARQYAREHNYDIINSMKDVEIARKKVNETTAIGLPQIDGSIGYNDYIDIPTMLIPGEFVGEPGTYFPVKFGLKYNLSFSATVSQLIFSGEYIVGLQATRIFVGFSQKQYDKMVIELEQKVAESYYLVLIAERNKEIIDSTLFSLRDIRDATVAMYENGFLEDTDVDQINLLISDLQATLINITNNMQISRNLLKFQIGLKLDNEIELTDNLDELLGTVDQQVLLDMPFDYRKNINYVILKNQEELAHLNMKRYKSQYLPRLYAFMSFQENAQRPAWNFFEPNEQWFKTTVLGVQMDIPLFQSGGRSSRVAQSKIKLEQIQVMDDKLKSGLEIQISTVRNNFLNAWKVYQNRKEGLDLSLNIYEKTREKLLEGVSSSIELQQNYNQYLNSEGDYVISMLELLKNKLELEKLLTESK
nr:TolC family protein [Bacteroidota bacterium]